MNESLVNYQSDMKLLTQGTQTGLWRRFDDAARRLLDIIVASVGGLILAPLFLLIAILIRRDSPGPVFYWGERIGRNGTSFRILKFRTMYETTASYNGPRVTGQGDSRITPLGQWLRDTKLNELPQLWNVLKGEMSVVGPRPEDREFVAHWPVEAREVLLSVRPGITSPASVLYRDEEALLQAGSVVDQYLKVILPTKLRLDLLYVHHRSLMTDLDVIFWTLMALLPALKTRRVPEHLLFWGPLARFVSRYFSWFVLDALATFVAIAVTGLIWRSNGPLELGLGLAIAVALAGALIFGFVNALLGVGRIVWSRADTNDAIALAISTGLTTSVLLLINTLWEPRPVPVPYLDRHLLPSGLIIVAGILSFAGFATTRYRMRIITGLSAHWINLRGKSAAIGERVLIVGAGEVGNLAAFLLQKADLGQAFSIAGMVDDSPRKQGARIGGVRVLGNTTEIPELVNLHDVGLIVFAIENIEPAERERIVRQCRRSSAQIVVLPDVLQSLRAQINQTEPDDFDLDGCDWDAGFADRVGDAPPLNSWLDEIDELMASEAWDDAHARVQALRQHLEHQDAAGVSSGR
jgi:lipopolysaccharide/colanic/teichoic acid biosynthesis glycosyltransferase